MSEPYQSSIPLTVWGVFEDYSDWESSGETLLGLHVDKAGAEELLKQHKEKYSRESYSYTRQYRIEELVLGELL